MSESTPGEHHDRDEGTRGTFPALGTKKNCGGLHPPDNTTVAPAGGEKSPHNKTL